MPVLKDFILQSSAADSCDALLRLFQAAVGELGYDIFVHSLLTNHPSIHKERSDHYVGKVMPGWQEHFIENELQYRSHSPDGFQESWDMCVE